MSSTTDAQRGSSPTLAAELASRDDADLVRLLRRRPDLASPAPSSVLALASRAGTRASVERALAGLDGLGLAVCEALVALDPPGGTSARDLAARVATGTGLSREETDAVLADLADLALTLGGRPVPALRDAIGPNPAGLGPWLADIDVPSTDPEPVTDARRVSELLAEAPGEARGTMRLMLWGPPEASTSTARLPGGAAWLVAHGLLVRADRRRVVLPREVALAAREGKVFPRAPRMPVVVPLERDAQTVRAEGARAAADLVRGVAELLDLWDATPATALKSGGVGVREMRRTAQALATSEGRAALIVEVAAAAGLLWRSDADAAVWAPSRDAGAWREDETPERWVSLVDPWLTSARAPWRAGSRDAQGTLLPVLGPTLDLPWAARLRAEAVAELAAHEGAQVPLEDFAAVLRFRHPRLPAHDEDLGAVLDELAELGVTGAGALTPAARSLVTDGPLAGVRALEAALPEKVDQLIVQGDLTAIVPGTPTPALAGLLDACTEVESRGSALTVRFTDASVSRGLDTGRTAEKLLEELRGFSVTPLPQPLEYLVRDVARRHGTIRVGAAGSYLRAESAEPLALLLGRPELAHLELRPTAPTVLVSPESPDVVARALRGVGQSPTLEDAQGDPVPAAGTAAALAGVGAAAGAALPSGSAVSGGGAARAAALRRRGRGAERIPTSPGRLEGVPASARRALAAAGPSGREGPEDERALGAVVRRARAGDEAARRTTQAARESGDLTPTDPLLALEVLRGAAAMKGQVDVVLVGGRGQLHRRRVRPLSVDAGRVRMRDEDRDVELTVSVTHIASATPAR